MNHWPKCFLLLLGLAAVAPAIALSGQPPMTRLVPDIETFPQSFAVVQDSSGIVYMAVADGVLVHDGAHWKLLPLPNHQHARTLAIDERDRVYVGGNATIGYIERGSDGRETYHDLSAGLVEHVDPEAMGDIWRLQVNPAGVWFQALRDLFHYDPDSGQLTHWHHEGRFGAMLWHQNQLWLQWRGEGLKRLTGSGQFEMVPGGDHFVDHVYFLLERPDGALLGLAFDGSWPIYQQGQISQLAAAEILGPATNYSAAVALPDGTVVLGTTDGQLQMIDAENRPVRRVRIGNDWVSGIFATADATLLALTNGIELVATPWPPSWTVVGSDHGIAGGIAGVESVAGRLYAYGSGGVFELHTDSDGSTRAERVDWTPFEAWDLHVSDGSVLLADSYQLLQIGEQIQPLSEADLYPRLLTPSPFDPDLLWIGTENGVAVARREAGEWRLAANFPDLNVVVTSLVESQPGVLWVGTMSAGVQRLRLAPDGLELLQRESLGEAEGLRYGKRGESLVRQLPEGLLASTESGMFSREDNRFSATDLGGLHEPAGTGETIDVHVAADGTRWAYTFNQVYRQAPGADWQRVEIRSMTRGPIQSINVLEDGRTVFGTAAALLVHSPGAQTGPPAEYPVRLRYVAWEDAGRPLGYLPLDGRRLELPHAGNLVRFRYSRPDLRAPDSVRYQSRLIGFEQNWSEWSTGTTITYTALLPGDYRYELRSRNAHGQISEIRPFTFFVTPPWHARWSVRLAGLLALIALLSLATWGSIRWRTAKLRADNLRLEQAVALRTRELRKANRQLEDLAHLDGLTGIANRRRFDAELETAWAQRPLSLLMMDVDRFKSYNDRHGHLAGDDQLQRIAHVLKRHCEALPDALPARYGGEEFAILLPGADLLQARALAEALRVDIAAHESDLTISIGIASATPRDPHPESLVSRADRALYQAKETGRNRVTAS